MGGTCRLCPCHYNSLVCGQPCSATNCHHGLLKVPGQLRLTADVEASQRELMTFLSNQKRYRELCFMLAELGTGKGKLKNLKKAMPSALPCLVFHLHEHS